MAQRICPKCNHVENEYTYFCTECGAKTIEYSGSRVVEVKQPEPTVEIQAPKNTQEQFYQDDRTSKNIAEEAPFGVENDSGNGFVASENVIKSEVGSSNGNNDVQNRDATPRTDKGITASFSNNSKAVIIGLVAVVGILLVVVIGLLASRGKEGTSRVADRTDAQEAAVYDEKTVEQEPVSNEEYATELADNQQESWEEEADPEEEIDESLEPTETFSDDGVNTYELIVGDVTWTEAYENCISRGGHLVRITTDEEYQTVLQQIYSEDKANIKFWIAGSRGDDDEYHWIYEDGGQSEEVINYEDKYKSYWLENEPSFYDESTQSEENRMNMFYMKKTDKWVWNDVPDDVLEVASFYSGTIGYICEYE